MMYKELLLRSFSFGKQAWLVRLFPSAHSSLTSLFSVSPWPPALVPTRKITAWEAMGLSRLTNGIMVNVVRREISCLILVAFPLSRLRDSLPLGARARAPPE